MWKNLLKEREQPTVQVYSKSVVKGGGCRLRTRRPGSDLDFLVVGTEN